MGIGPPRHSDIASPSHDAKRKLKQSMWCCIYDISPERAEIKMARDSEKRFHSIMDKLFRPPHSPSSSGLQQSGGKKRLYSTAFGAIEKNLRGDVAEGQQPLSAPAGCPQGPLCRPWDRGDFIRRLATFKSMLWFAKPEAVSAVNCARRGWVNVDVDTIACEACGARILFSTPASWNQQQVEKAALVFSLKLDSGHKLLCPWVDNACDETVARFPPTPSPILVENFKERCSALLQLSALPQISSSAIEDMKSPLLEEFLLQPLMLECGNGFASFSEIENVSSQHEMRLYYQAQKLISLCGWKPRSLPYLVDCKVGSTRSDKSTTQFDSSQIVANNNNSLIVHSANTDGSLEAEEKSYDFSGEQVDPNSVVLDCDLCGATVGLWAFCTVARPVELFRLVGYTDVNGENESGAQDSLDKSNLESQQGASNNMSDVATSSKDRTPSLNMTIAGGPPPTRQNFKATISLPVIGQNLRARLSYDSGFRNRINVSGGSIQSDSQNMRFLEEIDLAVNNSTGQIVPVSSGTREGSDRETTSQASIDNSVGDGASTQSIEQSPSDKDKKLIHTEVDGLNSSAVGDPRSSQKDLTEGEVPTFSQKNLGARVSSVGKDRGRMPSGKASEFDPIRQHRHFCPWIASIKDDEPGWLQTLSALCNQKSRSSPNRSPSSTSVFKVDDPIGSVRKLFISPSKKGRKLTRISDQSTEHR